MAIVNSADFRGGGEKKNCAICIDNKNATALRGICAIEIMIGHIGLPMYTNSIYLFPFRKAGILIVGIFFLLSGYGLIKQAEKKENYFSGFLKKRLTSLLVPAGIVYLSFSIISGDLLISIKKFYQFTNWYVFEILLFYIIFYILYGPKCSMSWKKSNVVLVTISVFSICLAFSLKITNHWYGSTLCFPLGIIYAQYEKLINNYLNRYFRWVMSGVLFLLILTIAAFFILGNESIIGNLVSRNISSLSFCIFVLMCFMKVEIGNKVSLFLGSISYEIFLVHFPILPILLFLNPYSSLVYALACIMLTLLIAYFLNKFHRMIGLGNRNVIKS